MSQINFMKRHNHNEKGVAVLQVFFIIKLLLKMAFILINLFKKIKNIKKKLIHSVV